MIRLGGGLACFWAVWAIAFRSFCLALLTPFGITALNPLKKDIIMQGKETLCSLLHLSLFLSSSSCTNSCAALRFAVIARAINGLVNGNVGIAKTYLGEITDASNAAKGFGLIGNVHTSIVGCAVSKVLHLAYLITEILQTHRFGLWFGYEPGSYGWRTTVQSL